MANLDEQSQAQGFLSYKGRLLNHLEMVYRPGERHLVTKLFTALGCTVTDSGHTHLGIAVGATDKFGLNNAMYASEVTAEQWALEEQLQKALEGKSPLSAAYAGYEEKFRRNPQLTSHFGIRYPSFEALEKTLAQLENNLDPELAGRVQVKGVFRPGEPGSMSDFIMQAFIKTDIAASGLITFGQHIELQAQRIGD
ncbi:MAG TPA: hypothetical protein VKB84_18745 [Candidatus Binataceae bacterium]|jgi:hypothetical protein|nr:hypothetical protein [Candidatus Binataceae bacterium]